MLRHRSDVSGAQIQAASAIGKRLLLNTNAVQHMHEQIRSRCPSLGYDMPASSDATRMTGDKQRQVGVRVLVSIAQRSPVQDGRMIEQ